MKKKLILLTLIGTIISVIIYFYTKSDEITFTSIGDGLAQGMTTYGIEGASFNDYLIEDLKKSHKLKNHYEYASSGKTVKELIYEIKENKKINHQDKKIEVQYVINEADILTIAIGMDELANKNLTKEIRNEFIDDIDELLSMIKMLNKKKVIVLGIYKRQNRDLLNVSKINAAIRDLCFTNKFTFLDINFLLNNDSYYLKKDNYHINYLGHEAIYKEIKSFLEL